MFSNEIIGKEDAGKEACVEKVFDGEDLGLNDMSYKLLTERLTS